jgi:hypothetical protein
MVVKDNSKDKSKKGGMRQYNLMNIKLSRFD